jgi:hypothetical protein
MSITDSDIDDEGRLRGHDAAELGR